MLKKFKVLFKPFNKDAWLKALVPLWNGPNKPILQRCWEGWKWCLKALRITPGTCEHCINICYSILIQFQNKLSGFQNCIKSHKNRKLESMQVLTGILLFPSSFWKMVGKWASWCQIYFTDATKNECFWSVMWVISLFPSTWPPLYFLIF